MSAEIDSTKLDILQSFVLGLYSVRRQYFSKSQWVRSYLNVDLLA